MDEPFTGNFISAGEATIVHSTLVAPTPASDIPSELVGLHAADLHIANSIIDGGCSDDTATSSQGWNVQAGGDSCGLTDPTDLVNVTDTQLKLGPLQDNGGTSVTHALGLGSVAIDRVPLAACLNEQGIPLLEDQRGIARPQGTACDVGAVERVP